MLTGLGMPRGGGGGGRMAGGGMRGGGVMRGPAVRPGGGGGGFRRPAAGFRPMGPAAGRGFAPAGGRGGRARGGGGAVAPAHGGGKKWPGKKGRWPWGGGGAYFAPPAWGGGYWGGGYPYWGGYPYPTSTDIYVTERETEPCLRLVADRDRIALRDAPANAQAALRGARSGLYQVRCAASCEPVLEYRSGRWTIVYYGAECAGLLTDSFQGIPVHYDSTSALSAAETPAPEESKFGMYALGAGVLVAIAYVAI